MIIDWHTHLHTPGQAAAPFWQGRCPMTIDNILTAQEEAGIDLAGLLPDEGTVLGLLDGIEPQQLDQLADRAPFSFARLQAALCGRRAARRNQLTQSVYR